MIAKNLLKRMNPTLDVKNIQDIYVRKNFDNLRDYFNTENQLLGFKFFEVELTSTQLSKRLAHGFNYIPRDILVTQIQGDVIVTFSTGKFTNSEFEVTASGPCIVRFYLGTYWNQNPLREFQPNDKLSFYNNLDGTTQNISGAGTQNITVLTEEQATLYRMLVTDDIVLFTLATGPGNIQLPLAKTCKGKVFTIQKTNQDSQYAMSISANYDVGETIDGVDSTTINTYRETLTIFSDGSNWLVLQRDYSKARVPWNVVGTWTTNTTYTGNWWRDGVYALYVVTIHMAGAPNAATLQISMPPGHLLDTASAGLSGQNFFESEVNMISGPAYYGKVAPANLSTLRIAVLTSSVSTITNINWTNTAPATPGAGTVLYIKARVPILGWKG